jgi:hypothetical protein
VSWYENLSYYVGLTDDNDLGIKYRGKFGLWDLQLAYYLGHEGSYSGESDDSARYSFDVARDAGAANEEKNLFNLRLAYNYTYNTEAKAEWVLSLQYGQIHNVDTNQNGDHYAFALHMDAYYQAWNLKLGAMRYEYHLKNPAGQDDDVVIIGAFDFAYEVAAKASLYEASLGYTFPLGSSKSVMPYVEYGIMVKDKSSWANSQFLSLGAVWNFGRIYIYSDYYIAQNQPYIGPDTFFKGLSSGSGNSDWHSRVNLTFSYFF